MRKLLLLVVIGMMSVGAFAKTANIVNERKEVRDACMREWTPFALTIFGPVGLPWGDWNLKGMQIGIFNSVYECSGFQIGVVNVADRMRGLQIGVINVITTNDITCLPILNFNF